MFMTKLFTHRIATLSTAVGLARASIGLTLALATLAACGAADPMLEPDGASRESSADWGAQTDAVEAPPSNARVLQEFDVQGDQRLTFLWLGQDESGSGGQIVISNEYRRVDRYAALIERYGELTSLETFLAFAPEGMAPDPALSDAHAAEATALGRADLAPRILDGRGLEVSVEKADVRGECTLSVFVLDPLPLRWRDLGPSRVIELDGVEFFGCVGDPEVIGQGNPVGCELYPTSSLLRMNACNSGQSVDAMTSTFFNQFGAIDISPVAIAPGTSRSITMLPEQVPPGQVAIARELAVKVKNNAAHPGNHGWFIGGQATL